MDSEIVKILDTERERYVDYFIGTTDLLKRDKSTFASELLVRTDDPSTPEPFDLIRVDFIYKNENNEDVITEFRLDKNLDYDNIEIEINNSRITIKPFCWNSCELTTDTFDNGRLKEWVIKWIKVDEVINGLTLEAIHNCTLPESVDEKHKFTIDLGTSPRTALLELMDSLTKTGTKEIQIETSMV